MIYYPDALTRREACDYLEISDRELGRLECKKLIARPGLFYTKDLDVLDFMYGIPDRKNKAVWASNTDACKITGITSGGLLYRCDKGVLKRYLHFDQIYYKVKDLEKLSPPTKRKDGFKSKYSEFEVCKLFRSGYKEVRELTLKNNINRSKKGIVILYNKEEIDALLIKLKI